MNDEVKAIFEKHFNSDYQTEQFIAILKELALAYDKQAGIYPESYYEGYALYTYVVCHPCKGDDDEWTKLEDE